MLASTASAIPRTKLQDNIYNAVVEEHVIVDNCECRNSCSSNARQGPGWPTISKVLAVNDVVDGCAPSSV